MLALIYLLKFIDTHLDMYYNIGLMPNMITTLGIIFGLLSMYNIFKSNYKLASFLLLIAYYFDCLDGYYARQYKMETELGDYYDHFSDITKMIIISYAVYLKRSDLFTSMNMAIVFVLVIMSLIHLGCQEKYHNKLMSPSLDGLKKLCSDKEIICYTKYFGTGTLMLGAMILVYNL